MYEAYSGYNEARGTLNQVRRGRGFWAVRSGDETFRGSKGKDSKGTIHKGMRKGSKGGKSGNGCKGGKGKSGGKSNCKSKGDPLQQRLVSRTQRRLCGAEDCPQADVDMPQAKRRVTFSKPHVGVGVSQAWGVETSTVSPSAESAETHLKMWNSHEIQESTMTMPEGHAI